MFKNIEEMIKFVQEEKVEVIDFKVVDMKGRWHRLTITSQKLDKSVMEKGIGFDGSSYGFLTVEKSDMVMIPDPASCFLDEYKEHKTIVCIADIYQIDGNNLIRFEDDPRYIAEKTESFMRDNNLADECLLGPEFEFFVLDHVSYKNTNQHMEVKLDSAQANWNSSDDSYKNIGYTVPHHGGYHVDSPWDASYEFRTAVSLASERANIPIKYHHSENGGPGQVEIEVNFAGIKEMADRTMKIKNILNLTAFKMRKSVTFMPKPFVDECGNGMHVHIQLKNKNEWIMYDKKGYAELSDIAHYAIGGILKHAKAITAITNPSTNSYKRLVPGYEAPVTIGYATANRSAVIRIPGYTIQEDEKRFELRSPDATANPYLAYSAIMMAAFDGIKNKIHPNDIGFKPYDFNLYTLSPEEQKKVKTLPTTLMEAAKELEKDYEFLLQGNVFSKNIINNHLKRIKEEYLLVNKMPHPIEFEMYYSL
ncbi:3-hydroxylaminophenol mutase [Candidatus Izimaplasma bacterium HR1]|jgi:glutamine synthetase|uniref:type I glutamate--ammonia ligase n=1 Tax=Candidatus Izimoplasma sp. HR1 TaxID=1541959 RepID=UPI0004F83AD8|nr:3-hydroxylaminophenol mutase [Candidatus Izimaplasma bacterium HR1]